MWRLAKTNKQKIKRRVKKEQTKVTNASKYSRVDQV